MSIFDEFVGRGIVLNPPLNTLEIDAICEANKILRSSDLISLYEKFNGFDDDFDEHNEMAIWPLAEAANGITKIGGKRFIPFADFSMRSNLYFVDVEIGNPIVWSGNESRFLGMGVNCLIDKWLKGDFDLQVGP